MFEVGLLPAAGRGVRAYPATTWIPKVLLEIAGRPLLVRNLEIMRDLGIKRVVVITGHLGDQIQKFLGDGSAFGVEVRYVECTDPTIGLARGILLAEPVIKELCPAGSFLTILGDELYLGTNHRELEVPNGEFHSLCGVMRTDNPTLIQKNYSVELESDRIVDLVEKPQRVTSNLLGCGTYVFQTSIFDSIRRTAPNPRTGKIELTDVIAEGARAGRKVLPFFLTGEYINVNSVEDYNHANYVARNRDFDDFKVSVVIPAFNEEDSIGFVVSDFVEKVHEVFVVDNSSKDRTAEIAKEKGARVETVSLIGYGDTIRYGLDHAEGDVLVVVEADHSFRSDDLGKFLEYLKDADMVIGTRTTRQMIEQGSNMGGLLRWGNVFVGKILELLWWSQEPRFTDVGCSYRALWRESWAKIRERVRGVGPEFSPEMMIEILRTRQRVIEIPVSYHPRVGGESKHSEGFFKVAKTASRMLKLIFLRRLGR